MSHFVTDTCGTIIGAILIKTLVTNWLSDWLESVIRALFLRTKRQFILYTHSKRHHLPTPDHNGDLFNCKDAPCDLLLYDDRYDW